METDRANIVIKVAHIPPDADLNLFGDYTHLVMIGCRKGVGDGVKCKIHHVMAGPEMQPAPIEPTVRFPAERALRKIGDIQSRIT